VLEMKRGQRRPSAIIDLSKAAGLRVLEATAHYLRLGAGLPFGVLASSDLVERHAPALARAASLVGSPQIRSIATLGGNIATASAAGDSLPALVAHGADLVIEDQGGERNLPVAHFLENRAAALKAGEIIREVRLPITDVPSMGAFVKLGRRNALAIARISAALVARKGPTGALTSVRLVLGAVAPFPLRVMEAEQLIEAKGLAPETWREAAEAASLAVARSIPGRPSAPYKMRAVKGLVLDLAEEVSRG